ncbi:hypothetical protein OHS70_34340 [Streptomyces sp. NBC_00390]|uniref:hypothetical protein n=1 Tax=Streptomyces sp. NBC_00390 TaxID=2975736 RepID=UPI002E1EE534
MGFDIYAQNPEGSPLEGIENYFRLGAFQGATVIDAMTNFGMVTDVPAPAWPRMADFGLTGEELYLGDEATAEQKAALDKLRAALIEARDWAEPEPAGIPGFKLRYNEGRLITPAELGAALTAYEAHPHYDIAEMPVGDLTWGRWTAFMRRARDLGGIRVH